jgi:hypothetical protein
MGESRLYLAQLVGSGSGQGTSKKECGKEKEHNNCQSRAARIWAYPQWGMVPPGKNPFHCAS